MTGTNSFASLQFTGLSSPEGFASKSLATENTVEPGPIVRELIQNSLDAGHLAGREQVKVCFALEEVATCDLPGIEEYERAFDAAKKTHKDHLGNVGAQISRIEKSLEAKAVRILNVRDNGIGLDPEKMNSLLGDGTTSKNEGGLAGSYGLGHFTAFPASNLQFVLYGGVTKDSTRTASAHAILASHEIDGGVKGKDGFLIKSIHEEKVRDRYVFPTNGEIAPLLDSQLDVVERDYGSGSVISITAFNNFLENDEDSSVMAILTTAAMHFSPAVHNGSLVVEVVRKNGSERKILDRQSLGSIIQENRKGRRSGEDKLSPRNAYNAYETLVRGEKREVETSFGKVTLCIRQSPQDTTQINLFRSGMWISNNLPRNRRYNYSDYKQFNALVLINPPSEAFDLVRLSEGEKHLDINSKRLVDEQKIRFDSFWGEIRNKITESLEKSESDEFSPNVFILTPPERKEPRSTVRRKSSTPETPEINLEEQVPEPTFAPADPEDPIYPDPGPGPRNPKKSSGPGDEPGDVPSFNRSGRVADVLTAAKFDSERVRLVIRSNEDMINAGVRLCLDNGADASCEKPVADQFIPFGKNALLDGIPLEDDYYREGREGALELLIGAIAKGQTKTVTLPLVSVLPQDAVVKVNIVSREKEK